MLQKQLQNALSRIKTKIQKITVHEIATLPKQRLIKGERSKEIEKPKIYRKAC